MKIPELTCSLREQQSTFTHIRDISYIIVNEIASATNPFSEYKIVFSIGKEKIHRKIIISNFSIEKIINIKSKSYLKKSFDKCKLKGLNQSGAILLSH